MTFAPTAGLLADGVHVGIEVVIDGRCTACGLCIVTCPDQALRRAPGRPAVVGQRCSGCMACVEVCPRDAVTVTTRRTR